MPVQNCDWKNAQMYQGSNSGGHNYPQFDERMFQQNMPTNGPVGYNQPNYNNHPNYDNQPNYNNQTNYNNQPPNYDNQGMNYNNQGMNYNTFQENHEQNPNPPNDINLEMKTDENLTKPLNPGNNYENYGFPNENAKP